MKKSGLFIAAFLLLTATGFVSSQGLSDLLNAIQPDVVILFTTFIIAFALLFFSLSKFFKGNTAFAGVISVAVAFLITYAVNQSGLNIGNFFYGFGISQEVLGVVIPIIAIAGIIFLIVKLKEKKNILLILGGSLIFLSFFVYEKTILIVVGVILIIIWVFLWFRKGKNPSERGSGAGFGGLWRMITGRSKDGGSEGNYSRPW
jgi:hypothetical protein